MPWSPMSLKDQKVAFINDFKKFFFDFSELCRRFSVSRKTGYKWISRYETFGVSGLLERSHRTLSCPHRTHPSVEARIVKIRHDHRFWGARKIRNFITTKKPNYPLPSDSTISDIIERNGLVEPHKRRRPIGHPGAPHAAVDSANYLWSVDFKGQDKTLDGLYCYPLTVMDSFSRYLLDCKGLTHPRSVCVKSAFTKLFRKYGLPLRIRSDNGIPFATPRAICRLSTLSTWWIRLGIIPELIEPGCPQQNGRHERMHWTLKQETMLPMAGDLSSQQRKFNFFRDCYNNERPHESLGQKTPASVYKNSPREMPEKLPPVVYPPQFHRRFVSRNGCFRWKNDAIFISQTLNDEYIGLETIDDGIFDVYYCTVRIGRFYEKTLQVIDIYYALSKN
jgi:putative transposase